MAYFTRGASGTGWGDTVQAGRAGTQRGLTKTDDERPEYDRSKLAGLQQEQMAPGLAELRRQMQSARGKRYGSLTGRSEALRGTYRGAGEAMAGLQAGAQRTAMGLYQPEYARDVAEWERREVEKAKEEERRFQRATPIGGGGTYRAAGERMEAYDPFGASARFAERQIGEQAQMPTRLTGATGGTGLLEAWERG